jgi:hypothetical protein
MKGSHMLELPGVFDILFTGREEYFKAKIKDAIVDAYGHTLYLVGPDGTVYNWSNVVIIKPARVTN